MNIMMKFMIELSMIIELLKEYLVITVLNGGKEHQLKLRMCFKVSDQLIRKYYFFDLNWLDAMNNLELDFNKLAVERINNDRDSGNINLSDRFYTEFNGMDFLPN